MLTVFGRAYDALMAMDPPVSEKQRRAMYAAASGHSTLGIPKKIGEEFVGKDAAPRAAGVMCEDANGRVLFLRRAGGSDHAGTWCFPGGGIEGDETPENAAARELQEETGYEAQPLEEIHEAQEPVNYHTFRHQVGEQFLPRLNDEHDAFAWAHPSSPPQPLHPGVEAMLADLRERSHLAADRAPSSALRASGRVGVAMDRKPAASVRAYDADGRMHVEVTNISKANVCPYIGREIPKWRELGLEPDRVYQLYRDPEELEKAAPTFNNLPLLSQHVPVTADSHQPELVVGSTGTDASFEAPYLRNSLVVWARDAIDAIESETRKELSCAYRYRADMTPGRTPDGEKYDGVMRDIVGNHVALVKDGRAGDDVIVGDSMERLIMSKHVLSRKAAVAQGALLVFLQPRLAQDAKLDLGDVLKDVGVKNWAESKKKIAEAVQPALAQDASPEALKVLLDSLDTVGPVEEDEDPPMLPPDAEKTDGTVAVDDPPPAAGGENDDAIHKKIVEFLQTRLSPEDLEEVAKMIGSEAGQEGSVKEAVEKPDAGAEDEEDKDMVTKTEMQGAMDAAIKNVKAEAKAIREAERAVKPWVGDLEVAFDSAAGVYQHALKMLGVDASKVTDAAALPLLLKAQPLPSVKKEPVVAMDAASVDSFSKMFPGAARISVQG